MNIADNVKSILAEIPRDVILIAATKDKSLEDIQQAVNAGITVIGENYLQEAESKFALLNCQVQWHYIGRLQTNKVKKAVGIFDMIQTVDSLSLARIIDKECAKIDKVMPILIEVNSAAEQQKTGVLPMDVELFLSQLIQYKNIKPMGLMTMGPAVNNCEDIRSFFKITKELFDAIKSRYKNILAWQWLSMGMSDSWKIAVQEGANMIRVGTAIFGERVKSEDTGFI